MATTTRERIVIRKLRAGWCVEDTKTHDVWTGLAYAGAVALQRHLAARRPA